MGDTKVALEAATNTPVPAAIEARFQALWAKNRDALLLALESRRVERTKNLEKNLDELAEREVNKIKSVMTELKLATLNTSSGVSVISIWRRHTL